MFGMVKKFFSRGYIPKVFAFKNPYPLNPEKSDLFYSLLIRMKQPKSPKFQRAVSSSSEINAIQHIPRDTTTLAFLMPLMLDFWRSIKRKARVVVSLGMCWMAWISDDDETALWNFGDFGCFVRMIITIIIKAVSIT